MCALTDLEQIFRVSGLDEIGVRNFQDLMNLSRIKDYVSDTYFFRLISGGGTYTVNGVARTGRIAIGSAEVYGKLDSFYMDDNVFKNLRAMNEKTNAIVTVSDLSDYVDALKDVSKLSGYTDKLQKVSGLSDYVSKLQAVSKLSDSVPAILDVSGLTGLTTSLKAVAKLSGITNMSAAVSNINNLASNLSGIQDFSTNVSGFGGAVGSRFSTTYDAFNALPAYVDNMASAVKVIPDMMLTTRDNLIAVVNFAGSLPNLLNSITAEISDTLNTLKDKTNNVLRAQFGSIKSSFNSMASFANTMKAATSNPLTLSDIKNRLYVTSDMTNVDAFAWYLYAAGSDIQKVVDYLSSTKDTINSNFTTVTNGLSTLKTQITNNIVGALKNTNLGFSSLYYRMYRIKGNFDTIYNALNTLKNTAITENIYRYTNMVSNTKSFYWKEILVTPGTTYSFSGTSLIDVLGQALNKINELYISGTVQHPERGLQNAANCAAAMYQIYDQLIKPLLQNIYDTFKALQTAFFDGSNNLFSSINAAKSDLEALYGEMSNTVNALANFSFTEPSFTSLLNIPAPKANIKLDEKLSSIANYLKNIMTPINSFADSVNTNFTGIYNCLTTIDNDVIGPCITLFNQKCNSIGALKSPPIDSQGIKNALSALNISGLKTTVGNIPITTLANKLSSTDLFGKYPVNMPFSKLPTINALSLMIVNP
jgi:hypothetical protein